MFAQVILMVASEPGIDEIRKKKTEAMKKKDPEVIVYSTPNCPYCTMAKSYLGGKGVKFTDYDVSKDRQRAEEMIAKSGQGAVPVLQINGRIIVGFDRQVIDNALIRAPPPRRDAALGNIIYDPFNI
jgi:glutaredoxin-like YruB-family protein